jgi:hypothetical protein
MDLPGKGGKPRLLGKGPRQDRTSLPSFWREACLPSMAPAWQQRKQKARFVTGLFIERNT